MSHKHHHHHHHHGGLGGLVNAVKDVAQNVTTAVAVTVNHTLQPQCYPCVPWQITGEKEPMLILDTSACMMQAINPYDATPKHQVIRESIFQIIGMTQGLDSQAMKGVHDHTVEAEGGGVRTIITAGGIAQDIGDLNTFNLPVKFNLIQWVGTPTIVPGWRTMFGVYNEEFGRRAPQLRPSIMALMIIGGWSIDYDQFVMELLYLQASKVFLTVAVIGFGPEIERTLTQFKIIEANNSNFRAVYFGHETSPMVIARSLATMIQ